MPAFSSRLAMGRVTWIELDISVRIEQRVEGMGIW